MGQSTTKKDACTISLTEREMQIAGLVAITWEKLSIDLHGLPCVGRKAGKKHATCFSRSSKRVEACGDLGEKFGYHFPARSGARFQGLVDGKLLLFVGHIWDGIQTFGCYNTSIMFVF